ncbi:MAG: SRPBCC family protein [Deltaproteobacteria bacterium]
MAKQSHTGRWIGLAVGLGATAGVVYLVYRAKRGISRLGPVTATVTINKPPREVYDRFHEFAQLPEFMTYLESVEVIDATTTKWTAKPLGRGKAVSWEARTLEDIPGQLIVWQSKPGSAVQTRGRITFAPAPGGNDVTEVRVEMQLGVSKVPASAKLARLFATPQVKGDMRRFKQVMETGEVLRSDASAHVAPHPAQPSIDAAKAPPMFVANPPTAEKGLGHPLNTAIGGKGVA